MQTQSKKKVEHIQHTHHHSGVSFSFQYCQQQNHLPQILFCVDRNKRTRPKSLRCRRIQQPPYKRCLNCLNGLNKFQNMVRKSHKMPLELLLSLTERMTTTNVCDYIDSGLLSLTRSCPFIDNATCYTINRLFLPVVDSNLYILWIHNYISNNLCK